MAKLTKYIPYVAGAAALAGAAYLYFRKKKEGQTTATTEPTTEPTPVVNKVINAPAAVDPWTAPAFVKVVRQIQEYLGVGIDGNPGKTEGSNTNKALKAKFPADFAANGALNPSTFVKWGTIVQNAINSGKMAQYLQESASGRKSFGDKLWNLGASGRNRIALKTGSIIVPFRTFDASRNVYVSTSQKATLTTNDRHLFAIYDRVGYDTDGFWILRYKMNPKLFILANPYMFASF